MEQDEIIKIRKFLHDLSNDLSVASGNCNILNKKFKSSNGSMPQSEFDLRIEKIQGNVDSSLNKVDAVRNWLLKIIENG